MDPEAAASLNNPLRRGVDLFSFPNFRTYQVGLTSRILINKNVIMKLDK